MAENNYLHITQEDNEYYVPLAAFFDTKKQDTLKSGENIKTINNQSLLGSGNIDISGGGGTISVDAELSTTSENPVQNKVITQAINDKQDKIGTISNTPMGMSLSAGNEFGFTIHPAASGATSKFIMTPEGSIEIHTNESDTQFRVTTDDILVSNGHGYTPKTTYSVANKGYVDTKQDKFATVTTADTIQTVKIGDNLSIITSPNFGYSQISSTKILALTSSNSTTSYIQLDKTKLGNDQDFDATKGYLRVRDNPLADDFAVNKKYVDNSVNTKLSATTDKYSISWDDTNEGIKITFKE